MGLPNILFILPSESFLHQAACTKPMSVLKSRPHDTDGGVPRMLEEAGQRPENRDQRRVDASGVGSIS